MSWARLSRYAGALQELAFEHHTRATRFPSAGVSSCAVVLNVAVQIAFRTRRYPVGGHPARQSDCNFAHPQRPMLSRFRRRTAILALLLSTATAYLNVACGSSSINVTAPTDVKCKVTAANSGSSAPADGMTGTITVSTNRDCTWSASTTTQWIALTSAVTGQGEGTLAYRVAANPDPSPRHGTVKVHDATVDPAQEAAVCRFSVDTPNTVAASGGSVAVAVTASSSGCTWTATSSVNWITIANAPNGSGNATVTLNVGMNTGSAREAGVTIAGHAITIRQAAAPIGTPPPPPPPEPPTPVPCTWTLKPGAQSIPTGGGNGTVAVDTGSQCAWTASASQ